MQRRVGIMLIAAGLLLAVGQGAHPPALAQSTEQAAPSKPTGLRAKTRESWSKMKERWALQRTTWKHCRDEARRQRLSGKKVRKFLEDCMTQ
jgi:hypothetical protein